MASDVQTLIVIPARFGSSRFPGKPLAMIKGQSMICRTAANARRTCEVIESADYIVATDDRRIQDHCRENDIPVVMTPSNLATGSDRVLKAAEHYVENKNARVEYVLNLQGDAPFTPTAHLKSVSEGLKQGGDVATPYIRLSWPALDQLREHKQITPFSGTTVIIDPQGKAIWFSKNIIPAIRQEASLRKTTAFSPVCRHIGLYGYRLEALKRFSELPESQYEKLEGLEQLRLIENGFEIRAIEVAPPPVSIPGIDTEADLHLAEALIDEFGEAFS